MNIDEIMAHHAVADFLETWAAHCGAPRKVFTGHVRAMLSELFDSAASGSPMRPFPPAACSEPPGGANSPAPAEASGEKRHARRGAPKARLRARNVLSREKATQKPTRVARAGVDYLPAH